MFLRTWPAESNILNEDSPGVGSALVSGRVPAFSKTFRQSRAKGTCELEQRESPNLTILFTAEGDWHGRIGGGRNERIRRVLSFRESRGMASSWRAGRLSLAGHAILGTDNTPQDDKSRGQKGVHSLVYDAPH